MTGKCPRCNKGRLFKNKGIFPLKEMTEMVEKCPNCGQKTELEVGFYYGTGYLSYALTVGFVLVSFFIGYLLFGVSFKDNSIFYLFIVDIIILILIQPWLMRFSRILYLSFFVKK